MEENSDKITYESLWKAIIRPPREYYREEDLGPSIFDFNGKSYIRKDFDIVDFRGKLLKVSFIEPDIKDRPKDTMPCVIYVHANASSRVEGINNKKWLLKYDINVCAFDFEGSGNSEGEYISLGYHEKHQLKNIVDFVEKYPGVGEIGLWGRSMGAATTLIYASMDRRIKAIVVDSPFSDFRRVAKEMCLAQVTIPGFLIEGAISIIGKSVYKRNKMKINEIKAIEAVKNCYIPVIFIHARDDDMVKFQHSLDLFNNYAGNDKQLKEVTGGHNAKRPTVITESIGRFFAKHLKDDGDDSNNIDDDDIKKSKTDNYLGPISSSMKDNIIDTPEENYNYFDLNKRKGKTIYEEWGMNLRNNSDHNIKNINKEKNKDVLNDNKNKEEDKKIDNKQEKMNSNDNNQTNYININQSNINSNFNPNNNMYSNNINANANEIVNKDSNINNNINENIDINQPKIKRKTIYDDLNLRK